MLKTLTIKNVQGHKNSTLNFHKGLNMIVGPSDQGKSTIVRSLNFVYNNKSNGKADFRRGMNGMSVTSVFDDCTVVRTQKRGTNNYILNDGEPFKAFGKRVPEEIERAVNLNEVNWQFQHDSPFLVSQSSGHVARFLNHITGMEAIDSGISSINKYIRDTKDDLEEEQERFKQIKKDLKEYEGLEEAENLIEQWEAIHKKIYGAKADIENLEELKNKLSKWTDLSQINLDRLKKPKKLLKKYDEIKNKIEELKVDHSEIRDYRMKAVHNRKVIKQGKEEVEKLKEQLPNICSECGRPYDK